MFGQRSNKGPIRLSTDVAARLMTYAWPGNVRELENCIEHAIAVARFDQLTVEDLPEAVRAYRADRLGVGDDSDEILPIEEVERRYMLRVLKQLDGNKTRAAQMLGIDRRTFHRKLAQFETGDLEQLESERAGSVVNP
jgi:two-component system response regulator HydG